MILASTIFVALATAEGSNTDVISELRKTHPTVKWNSTPTLVADVLCDGKPDNVILGSEKNNVVVGVVSSVRPHNTQVLSFPIGSATQDGFCAFPVRIETSPLKCEADVGTLPGASRLRVVSRSPS